MATSRSISMGFIFLFLVSLCAGYCLADDATNSSTTSTTTLSYSLGVTSKNFANARRVPGKLQAKIFTDKPACGPESNSSIPFVQIHRKSGLRFHCNGLLLSSKLVLTTASCLDQITNTNKYSVVYRLANNSLASSPISWTCKHPRANARKISRQRNVALVILDNPVAAEELKCFATSRMDYNRRLNNLVIARMEDDIDSLRRHSLDSDYLSIEFVECPELAALSRGDAKARADESVSVCFKFVNTSQPSGVGSDLCNLQAAMVHLTQWQNDTGQGAGRSLLGMITNLAGAIDERNCLTGGAAGQAISAVHKAVDLTKLWHTGDLNVLIHHCA